MTYLNPKTCSNTQTQQIHLSGLSGLICKVIQVDANDADAYTYGDVCKAVRDLLPSSHANVSSVVKPVGRQHEDISVISVLMQCKGERMTIGFVYQTVQTVLLEPFQTHCGWHVCGAKKE